jgi:hypothetical protein
MRFCRTAGLLLGLVYSLPVLAMGVTPERLRSYQAALTAAQRDFDAHAADLSDAEAADYSAYIERLRNRLLAGCSSLRRTGVEPPADVSCPQGTAAAPPAVAIDQGGERTHAEHTGDLDSQLQEGLGAFDEKLLREQARVKAQAPRSAANGAAGTGSGTGGGGGGSGSADGDEAGEPGSAGTTASSEAQAGGDVTADRPQGPAGSAGGVGQPAKSSSGAPADIPDGSDDDVVARQLREAAEKETDPVLKEKLWDEYRKYKQGTR